MCVFPSASHFNAGCVFLANVLPCWLCGSNCVGNTGLKVRDSVYLCGLCMVHMYIPYCRNMCDNDKQLLGKTIAIIHPATLRK